MLDDMLERGRQSLNRSGSSHKLPPKPSPSPSPAIASLRMMSLPPPPPFPNSSKTPTQLDLTGGQQLIVPPAPPCPPKINPKQERLFIRLPPRPPKPSALQEVQMLSQCLPPPPGDSLRRQILSQPLPPPPMGSRSSPPSAPTDSAPAIAKPNSPELPRFRPELFQLPPPPPGASAMRPPSPPHESPSINLPLPPLPPPPSAKPSLFANIASSAAMDAIETVDLLGTRRVRFVSEPLSDDMGEK